MCMLVSCGVFCLEASNDHASGTGQLHASQPVVGPRLFPGKPTQRAVTTMKPDDLVVGKDYMVGPSSQQYNWQRSR